MNPRTIIALVAALVVAFSTSGCLAAQKVKSEQRQSPLFSVRLAQGGSQIFGDFIPIKGKSQRFEVTFDQPHGSLYGAYRVQSIRYKIGNGKWVKVKKERHGHRFMITVNNQRNNSETFLIVEVTWAYVSAGIDNHGQVQTDQTDRVATASAMYQIKYYR
ncbi:MAG: hypothetical protein ACOYUK_01760 [Patescibacteria group bacterium]